MTLLLKKLNTSKKQITESTAQLETLSSQLAEEMDAHQNTETKVVEMTAARDQLAVELANLQIVLESRDIHISELDQKLLDMQVAAAKLCEEFQTQLDQSKQQLETQKAQFVELSSSFESQLQQQISETSAKLLEMQAELANVMAEKELVEDAAKGAMEAFTTEKKLSLEEKDKLNAQLMELNFHIEESDAKSNSIISDLQSQLASESLKNHEYSVKIESDYQRTLLALQAQVDELHIEKHNLESEVFRLRQLQQEVDANYASAQLKAVENIQKKEAELETQQQKQQEIELKLSTEIAQAQKQAEEVEKFKNRANKLSATLSKLQKDNKTYKQQLEKYRNEVELLQSEMRHKDNTIKEKEAECAEKEEEIEEKEKTIHTLEKQVPTEKMLMQLVKASHKYVAVKTAAANSDALVKVQSPVSRKRPLTTSSNAILNSAKKEKSASSQDVVKFSTVDKDTGCATKAPSSNIKRRKSVGFAEDFDKEND